MSVTAGADDRGDSALRDGAQPRGADGSLETIVLEPAPEQWALRSGPGSGPSEEMARAFREQLGLPAGPVVMSGHQAGLWHCGILAKWFALEGIAQRDAAGRGGQGGVHRAWLVVDTDDNEPTVVNYPAQRTGDGRLEVRQWQAAPGLVVHPGTPTGQRETIDPAAPPQSGRSVEVPALVGAGLGRAAEALRGRASAGSLAAQFAGAAADLIESVTGSPAPTLILASEVGQTDLFAEIVRQMTSDPAACARAYNAAVLAHREAKLRPLVVNEQRDRIELPLWWIDPASPRRAVYASELADGYSETLAPRALLLTGLMRLAGCDLFIHGTGGGVYDRVMEAWLGSWLEGRAMEGLGALAPSVVATATRLLPLSDEPPPSPAALARAQWEHHAARHDPAMVGEEAAAREKQRLAQAIAQADRGATRRAALYRQMQELLEEVRARQRSALSQFEERASELRDRLRDGEVVLDRTWSFVLFPDETLRALRQQVLAEVGA